MFSDFGQWLSGVLIALFDAFVDFFVTIFLTLFDLLKEILYFLFDSIMALCVSIIETITPETITFNPQQYIDALPPEILNVAGLIGLDYALGIITLGITIRFILQLIPLVRLGS